MTDPIDSASPWGGRLTLDVGFLADTAITDQGPTVRGSLQACYATDKENLHCFGANGGWRKTDSIFFNSQEQGDLLVNWDLLKKSPPDSPWYEPALTGPSYSLGLRFSEGYTFIETASDLLPWTWVWKNFSLHPALRLTTGKGLDDLADEVVSNISLQGLLELGFIWGNENTVAVPAKLTTGELSYSFYSGLHQILGAETLSRAFATRAGQALAAFGEESGQGLAPSSNTESLSSLMALSFWGGTLRGQQELSLQLRAEGDQLGVLIARDLAVIAGHFGFGLALGSTTHQAQVVAETLRMAGGGIERAYSGDANRVAPLLWRMLIGSLAFLSGWPLAGENFGQALLQGGMGGMGITAIYPNPTDETESQTKDGTHGLFEWASSSGGYIGIQQITDYNDFPVYTRFTGTTQAFPFQSTNDLNLQGGFDALTDRNALSESAKARITSGLGLQTKTGPATWRAGAHTLFLLGQGAIGLPGIGVHAGLDFSGTTAGVQGGVGVFGELLYGGELQLGIGPYIGWKG